MRTRRIESRLFVVLLTYWLSLLHSNNCSIECFLKFRFLEAGCLLQKIVSRPRAIFRSYLKVLRGACTSQLLYYVLLIAVRCTIAYECLFFCFNKWSLRRWKFGLWICPFFFHFFRHIYPLFAFFISRYVVVHKDQSLRIFISVVFIHMMKERWISAPPTAYPQGSLSWNAGAGTLYSGSRRSGAPVRGATAASTISDGWTESGGAPLGSARQCDRHCGC